MIQYCNALFGHFTLFVHKHPPLYDVLKSLKIIVVNLGSMSLLEGLCSRVFNLLEYVFPA